MMTYEFLPIWMAAWWLIGICTISKFFVQNTPRNFFSLIFVGVLGGVGGLVTPFVIYLIRQKERDRFSIWKLFVKAEEKLVKKDQLSDVELWEIAIRPRWLMAFLATHNEVNFFTVYVNGKRHEFFEKREDALAFYDSRVKS